MTVLVTTYFWSLYLTLTESQTNKEVSALVSYLLMRKTMLLCYLPIL